MENKRPGRVPDIDALLRLKAARRSLTREQYRILRGQIYDGQADGAMRGLQKILQRRANAVKNDVSRKT